MTGYGIFSFLFICTHNVHIVGAFLFFLDESLMTSFNNHIAFFDDVWGLNAYNVDTFREEAVANANLAPFDDPLFVYRRFEMHKADGTDPSSILAELVSLGPCVFTLCQLSGYLRLVGTRAIQIPRSEQKCVHDEGIKADRHDDAAQHKSSQVVFVNTDAQTLEMGIFTLWVHHFVQHQLTDAVFVNPATVFVPIATHNEIMLFGSVLATLIVNGCDATNVLLLQDATGEEEVQHSPRHLGRFPTKEILRQICFRYDLYLCYHF